jgi:hypothetical protein
MGGGYTRKVGFHWNEKSRPFKCYKRDTLESMVFLQPVSGGRGKESNRLRIDL